MQKIIQSFFWGIFAAGFALIAEILLQTFLGIIFSPAYFSTVFTHFSFSIFLFVLIEEISKYIIISKKILLYSKEKSALLNTFIAGAGFSFVELTFIYNFSPLEFFTTQILIQIAILHIATFGIIAYYSIPNKITLKPVLFTFFIHSLYNLIVLLGEKTFPLAIPLLLAIIILLNIWNLFTAKHKLAS
ncbi:MAG: hypothetical protein UR69_C0002G0100 [Candidatus Moranbacteria bacterium GW2011_GWE2_35_2-]|nr:MAG: hypothetical protein UR69_C0002G0100 [Candidatus Moranbacteria bacterium GW2011_GWE2_35_2-]KKQ04784.1 MAG: hypothetical protein US15_C0044G0004 [Candidatus Moranbacteria bacterium GW2011_GWF1_36_4]KKQ22551.1 MAG: hypothetical protein US37_C0002G0176 [Candidatus Moranbacteria bacterium GW2011_GWF2_37_11]KKQ29620.1 MAG: hypothetical protein US44_C0001G0212 [Candidatus Moranbacteria bacterium GW2011_GWD1_37_17]KKQ30510.1 MAG: hypothetical protein US47_C0002G0100 [Candidatus Moranbacteria b